MRDSSSAPTSPTPSGITSTAVSASAPDSPNADTSPVGVTEPPTASATTAAAIGPNAPAVSASRRRRPSAAVPAIPISAQLTAATADITTSAHGRPVRRPGPAEPVAVLMGRPPDPRSGPAGRTCPPRVVYHSPGRFQPPPGQSRRRLVAGS